VKRVVILGGGVGGVIAARELSRRAPAGTQIDLVDREGRHSFAPSYPWVAMGWRRPEAVSRPLLALRARGVRHHRAQVISIHPGERTVRTDAGELAYDYLLIALGAELDPGAIEGFAEGANHPYDLRAAERLRDAVRAFRGGRVAIGVTRLPFKCPAAPYEMALLLDAHFREEGIRHRVEIEFFTPEPYPTPAAGEAIGRAIESLLKARGIPLRAKREVDHIDSRNRLIQFKGNGSSRYDLLVAVPPHTTNAAVRTSGLAKEGPWIPVDPRTLRTGYDDVYAVGDVTKIPTPKGNVPFLPKAGVFAEGQAKVAAANILAGMVGTAGAQWDGYGVCFLESGHGRAGMVRGNFYGEGPPIRMRRPSRVWHWGKVLFERRWMGSLFRKRI